jgi:hypothetical protein
LSRFILALKVALAEEGGASTMIFDEIDRGVGGARNLEFHPVLARRRPAARLDRGDDGAEARGVELQGRNSYRGGWSGSMRARKASDGWRRRSPPPAPPMTRLPRSSNSRASSSSSARGS